jgi:hypothetical protein
MQEEESVYRSSHRGGSSPLAAKSHRLSNRPPLQGGGALGSYQAGVYEALAEADLHPNWVAAAGFPAVEIEGEYYWDGGLISARDRRGL